MTNAKVIQRNKKVNPQENEPPNIRDFENAIIHSKLEQQKALAYLVTCAEHLSKDDHSILRDLLPMEKSHEDLDVDLKQMMQEQMNAARALRNQYFNLDGSLRQTVDHKEAREALGAAQKIMDSILKKQDKIDLITKNMIMEQSLLAIASKLPPDEQTKFYDQVKRIYKEKN